MFVFFLIFISLFNASCRKTSEGVSTTKAFYGIGTKQKSRSIKVCWVDRNPKWDNWKQKAQASVTREWQNKTVLEFYGWQLCEDDSDGQIRVAFLDEQRPASCIGISECGLKKRLNATMLLSPSYYNIFATCRSDFILINWMQESCFEAAVVHEFGHAIGLWHEQDRYDASCTASSVHREAGTAEPIGPYDTKSVMNYCNVNNKLSSEDALAINQIYMRNDYEFWGQLKLESGKCLAFNPELKQFHTEVCAYDRQQLFGLKANGRLHYLGSKDSQCVVSLMQSMRVEISSCRSANKWIFDSNSGRLHAMSNAEETSSVYGFQSLFMTEKDGSISLSQDEGPKSKWSWPMMIQSDFWRFRLITSYGGRGGKPFDDRQSLSVKDPIKVIWIRSGDRLDQIGVEYSSGRKITHGASFAKYQKLELKPGEYIAALTYSLRDYKDSARIFGAEFTTNYGRVLRGGNLGKETIHIYVKLRPGEAIWGFHGHAGKEVDRLGVYTLQL